jgi:hypothetical protein
MTRAFFIALCCAIAASPATAAQIPDLSLTPQETYRQVDKKPSDAPLGDQPPPSQTNPEPFSNAGENSPAPFMHVYCDPKNMPPGVGENGLSGCLNKMHQEACRRFAKLPNDAKTVVDQAVACGNSFSPAPGAECASIDARRMDVSAKYKTDPDTVEAIATVPKMVNEPMGNCQVVQ